MERNLELHNQEKGGEDGQVVVVDKDFFLSFDWVRTNIKTL
jgi:hypothetical protein